MLFSGSLTAKPSLGEKRCWCKSSSESLIPSSSMAEHDAVNVGVSGSSPLLGAKQGVAQSGQSTRPGTGGFRRFKSCHPDYSRLEFWRTQRPHKPSAYSARLVRFQHLLSAVIV